MKQRTVNITSGVNQVSLNHHFHPRRITCKEFRSEFVLAKLFMEQANQHWYSITEMNSGELILTSHSISSVLFELDRWLEDKEQGDIDLFIKSKND